MRLSEPQREHIVNVISSFFEKGDSFKVALYGSRTKDYLSGGDIDLVVLCSEEHLSHLSKNRYKILNEFKKSKEIGDRRIDLSFSTQENLDADPFLKTVKMKC